ncbi:hypothetical protein POUND7_015149, partial [Theobroma cacao]
MLRAIVPALTWFGAFVFVLGVEMLESSGSPPCVGDLLNFLSAVFFGLHMLRIEHISRSTNKRTSYPLLDMRYALLLFCQLYGIFLEAGLMEVGSSTHHLGLRQCFGIGCSHFHGYLHFIQAYSRLGCSYGWSTYKFYIAIVHDVSATETTITYGLEPVWGASFTWFLLGERWSDTGWIGASLVL